MGRKRSWFPRKNRKPTKMFIRPPIISETAFVKLKFTRSGVIGDGTATLWGASTRLNDAFDPRGTSGNDQPDGFDKWCASNGLGLYRNFLVYGSRYTVTMQNKSSTGSARVAIFPCDANEMSTSQKWDDLKDSQRLHKCAILPGTGMGNSRSTTRTMSMYCSTAKACGDSKAMSDSKEFGGSYQGSPTQVFYWKMVFDSWPTSPVNLDVFYTLTYYIKFYNAPFIADDVGAPTTSAETGVVNTIL